MKLYMIESKAGVVFGVHAGETPGDAFAAMVAEGGGQVGDETVGTAADWIITEVPAGRDEVGPSLVKDDAG